MTIELLDGNKAAAYGAMLSKVKCAPCFPITPQTEIVETLAKWKVDGKFKGEYLQLESEHSVLSAALGSQLTGARTFTATSSQGLMLMHEIMMNVSGMRLPMVMVNVSRGLSAPITLWCDHNDVLAVRDSGWIIFMCETNQEVLDSIIMAYKIAENKNILLPVLVNMDGFIQSYTRTQVDIPQQELVNKFLPEPNQEVKIDLKKPKTFGTPAMEDYMFFRSQVHKAQLDSKEVIKNVHKQWKNLFKREYDFIERYKLEKAKIALVIIGANTTIAKSAVDKLRKKRIKVGLLRIRMYRPFPEEEIKQALKKVKKVIVLDQNISPGMSGILYPEIKAALYGTKKIISNYILGLGGKPFSDEDVIQIIKDCKKRKEKRKWLV